MGGNTPEDGQRLVNGRYRLIEVIGRGGMGTVWRGHDEMLDREVAIKEVTLSPDLDDEARAELSALALQEARATARLNHPGIITIHDVIDDDGVPIIVMELLHGRSLADILREEVRLPYRRVAEIGAAALDALREAHATGVVHRDLKPANILITDRRIVITDFGVAQRVGERTDEPGDVTGTPAFMAPEQAESAAASPAVDLWALGATLFNATEGKPPYEGPDYATVLLTLLTQDPPAPVRAGPLAPLITALLRRDPERRPSAEEVGDRLAEILREEPGSATTKSATAESPPAATAKPTAPWAPPSSSSPPPSPKNPASGSTSGAGPVRKAQTASPKITPSGYSARTGYRRPSYYATRPPSPPTARRGGAAAILAIVIFGIMLAIGLNSGSGGTPTFGPSDNPSDPLSGLPSDFPQPTPSESTPAEQDFNATALSPDGDLVAFGSDTGVVRLYDAASHKLRHSWKTSEEGEEVKALAFSPDGRTVAASASGDIDVWDVATHKKRKSFQLDDVIEVLGFSPDGRTLTAAGSDGKIGVWTVRTGKHSSSSIPLPHGNTNGNTLCLAMAVSSDGRYVACGYYDGQSTGGVIVWNAEKNKQRASWPGVDPDGGVAFSPDGKTLAFPGKDSLQLWNIDSHRMTDELDTSPMSYDGSGLAFSPDGRTLAVPAVGTGSSEDSIEIWKIPGGEKTATLPSADVARRVGFSHDGDRLVSAEGAGGALWNVRSHKKLASWTQ